jgi:transcriptional regulator with GAF, ATPase, and Fis domain
MSSAVRGNEDINLAISSDRVRAEAVAAQDKVRVLKQMAMELQRGLESLNQVPTPAVEQGLDFYHEVSHFEIELIKRALTFVEGHQGKAARLLNLNASTLGSKIKHYQIQLDHPVSPASEQQNNGES